MTRHTARLAAALFTCLPLTATACLEREPTPPASLGPHDFEIRSTATRLWHEGDAGEPLFISLRVMDTCSAPLAGATVRLLHANHVGDHEHDRWRTVLTTDASGEARVLTVFPGYAGGLPRHIHLIVEHAEQPPLITRLFFKNDPEAGADVAGLSAVLERVRRDEIEGWVVNHELVLPEAF